MTTPTVPGQPAWQPVIHCRHDGVIEHVAVDVDPESFQTGAHEVLNRFSRRALHAPTPNIKKVDHLDRRVLDALAPGFGGLLSVSSGELDDVIVQDQWTASLQVDNDLRTPACDQRQVHRSGLPVWLGFGLVEVGVSIDEQEPIASASA